LKTDKQYSYKKISKEKLASRVLSGDETAAARLISMIENGDPQVNNELPELFQNTGQAHLIGITGSPGCGKSTISGRLGAIMSNSGQNTAIIAIDPSYTKHGGAFLGDRVRMKSADETGSVFIRSMADRGIPGGICSAVRGAEYVLEALGKQVVLVESVGAGQSDRSISLVVDTVVTIFTPDYGDDLQLLKAGLHNIGDIVVMNKSDHAEADKAFETISFFIKNSKQKNDNWRVPVIRVECIDWSGIDNLLDAINKHKQFLDMNNKNSGRRDKDVQFTLTLVKERLWNSFEEKWSNDPNVKKIITDVHEARIDPYSAVQQLLNMLDIKL